MILQSGAEVADKAVQGVLSRIDALAQKLGTTAAQVWNIYVAIGFGEGSEQNAPLGRAVIGGLLFATVSTVLFVPVLFGSLHRQIALRKEERNTTA